MFTMIIFFAIGLIVGWGFPQPDIAAKFTTWFKGLFKSE